MVKKIFLTGGTGNMGLPVTKALVSAGYHVIALARTQESAAKLTALGTHPVIGELGDVEVVTKAASEADAAIHVGAVGGPENVPTDKKVTEVIIRGLGGSGKKFVYTSGPYVYGNHGDEELDEDTLLVQETSFPYGKNWRVSFEGEILALAAANKVDAVIIRPTHVVTKSTSTGFLSWLAELAEKTDSLLLPGDGENFIPFIHEEDVGSSYVAALEKAPAGIYNANSGSYKLKDFAEAARPLLGNKPIKYITPEEAGTHMHKPVYAHGLTISMKIVHTNKLEAATGWKPKHNTLQSLFQ